MTDQTVSNVARDNPGASTFRRVAILAALASSGTLATNILLPSLPEMAASLRVTTADVTASITVFLIVFAIGQLAVGPLSDRYGRRIPVLAGFAIFIAGSVWCAVATDLPQLLTGRMVQAAGACATSVLSRAIARDLYTGTALARVMALITIAMAAAPGFSPLLGGALDHYFGWRSEFVFVGVFAAIAAVAYGAMLGETHRSTRIPLNPGAIAKTYFDLSTDRRFLIPAMTVALIMGGLFAMFSASPRVMIEALHFAPMQLGLFFAGTVMVVFTAGMLATKLAPRLGLDRSIQIGLALATLAHFAEILLGMVADRQLIVRADEQVQFADLEFAVVVELDRMQHREQRIAVLLDLRPLMPFACILERKLVQPELLAHQLELLGRRVLQRDPHEAFGLRYVVADGLDLDVGELAAVLICSAVDQHVVG